MPCFVQQDKELIINFYRIHSSVATYRYFFVSFEAVRVVVCLFVFCLFVSSVFCVLRRACYEF